MTNTRHEFTKVIDEVLLTHFKGIANEVYAQSTLIQYINQKTRSATRGSKSRGSFGALYSIYTLLEDYVKNGFDKSGDYSKYEGARQTQLIDRQRSLPFGKKLQNHYFQNRTNTDYRKYYPSAEHARIIIHDQESSRYWINEQLLNLEINGSLPNIAIAVIEIIDRYVETKKDAFENFVKTCTKLRDLSESDSQEVIEFIKAQLAATADARLFEIVSYSILKHFYSDTKIYWGYERNLDKLNEENLSLYKTGRTNANDGGIDFVMRPLGRFFQVTETLDFKKYFLDIDKLQRFPITFVVKADDATDLLLKKIKADALVAYTVESIVDRYMRAIEEVINIPKLLENFNASVRNGKLRAILDDIITQSKVEFNYEEVAEDSDDDAEEDSELYT